MNYYSLDYQKFLAEHCVFDTWQFMVNAHKNLNTAKYCLDIVCSLLSATRQKHIEWQEKMNNEIDSQIKKFGKANVGITEEDLKDGHINILGVDASYGFLIDKYIKDFFQYTRNTFDSMAQILNCALLANNKKDIEKVDFTKIEKEFVKDSITLLFPNVSSMLTIIKMSEEYKYISEFNNKVKHISDAEIILSQSLISNETSSKIETFEKNSTNFPEMEIETIIKKSFDFTYNKLNELLAIMTQEIPQHKLANNRLHSLKYYGQDVRNDSNSSFYAIFIEVENDLDEIEDNIYVLPLCIASDEIRCINSNFDDILVRNKKEKYVGRFLATKSLKKDGIIQYREYRKDNCDGMLAFIKHTKQNYNIYPFIMNGTILRAGY